MDKEDQKTVVAVLEQSVGRIFSDAQSEEWLDFRDCLEDEILRNIPKGKYILHMRALCLQLIGAVLAKTQGARAGGLAGMEFFLHLRRVTRQHPEFSQTLDDAYSAYNKAYGSSSTNGVGEMVKVFSRRACNGALSSEASGAMMDLLQGAWSNLEKKLKVTGGGPTQQGGLPAEADVSSQYCCW